MVRALLIAWLSLILLACGGTAANPPPTPTATSAPTATPTPTIAPTPTFAVKLKVAFRCLQDYPAAKAGFIAGGVAEVPGTEELMELVANDFDTFKLAFEETPEGKEGVEMMYQNCIQWER